MKEGVLILNSNREIPKETIALSRGKDLAKHVLLPVLGKVVRAEFDHKCIEG